MKPFEVPVSSKYGAPMGRSPYTTPTGKVHLERVRFYDGDYDKGGAYWGSGGSALYCAWNESGALYVRALNRNAAKALLLTSYRNLKFFR